jgi:hypothetical protein
MLNQDEMNCNLVSRVFFTICCEVQILVICNNHEYDEKMNCNVKFIET